MKKMTLLCCMMAGMAFADIIKDTQSRPQLAAVVEVAPFGDISRKTTMLGQTINNPIVPTLLISSLQQSLSQSYGNFRTGSPIYLHYYLQMPAIIVAATNDNEVAVQDLCEQVMVYPSTDGIAKMTLNHPGSVKDADGTLHLLANAGNPNDRWVKFTEDGQYCAIARSGALAKLAIADFAKGEAARKSRKGGERPLVRVDVVPGGFKALTMLQEAMDEMSVAKPLNDFIAGVLEIDLNDRGFQLEGRLIPRKDAKVFAIAGAGLPAGALDFVPAKSPFFFGGMNRLQSATDDEAEFRRNLVDMSLSIRTNVVADLKRRSKMSEKDSKLMDELADIFVDCCRQLPFPSLRDWGGVALGFDAGRHPFLAERAELAKAGEMHDINRKAIERLVEAIGRRWPGKDMVVKTPAGFAVAWDKVIDVAAAESGLKGDDVKEITNAKQTIAEVLGGNRTDVSYVVEGERINVQVASPGLKLPTEKSNGEARLAAALPETVQQRPGAVVYLSVYDLVRDVVLPVTAKFAKKSDAAQYQAMIKGMAAAEANSAIAGALWYGKDGSCRALLRITTGELKNYGAAFNAFTAASMSSAVDDEGDDDK